MPSRIPKSPRSSTLSRRRTVLGSGLASSRSEEHTSELQSLTNLVCRLLLEKKKNYANELVDPARFNLGTGHSAASYRSRPEDLTTLCVLITNVLIAQCSSSYHRDCAKPPRA